MSNSTKPEPNEIRFRLPPVESQIVLGVCAALLGMCAVQFESLSLLILVVLGVLFAIGMLKRQAWAIYVMLGMFLVLKYLLMADIFRGQLHRLRFPDLFFTLIVILLAAACFRFLESGRFLQTFYPNIEIGEKQKSGSRFQFPSLLGGRWWVIPLSIFLSAVLLAIFPARVQLFQDFRIRGEVSRLVFLTLFLFFGWFVCRAALGMFIRWRMDKRQADVHCRSLIAQELWRDTYSFAKRQKKIQSRD